MHTKETRRKVHKTEITVALSVFYGYIRIACFSPRPSFRGDDFEIFGASLCKSEAPFFLSCPGVPHLYRWDSGTLLMAPSLYHDTPPVFSQRFTVK